MARGWDCVVEQSSLPHGDCGGAEKEEGQEGGAKGEGEGREG